MKSVKVVNRLSFTLATYSFAMVAVCFHCGILPDWYSEGIDHRAKQCELLASSLSLGPIKIGEVAARQHLQIFQSRIPEVNSLGLRRSGGPLFTQVGNHEQLWSKQAANQTDGRFVVPIVKDNQLWGHLEVSFTPLRPWGWQSYLPAWLGLALSLGFSAFCLSRLILGRTLRYLDPSRIVPARVRETLDSFAEGVLLLDNKERIVLANQAFADSMGVSPESLLGKNASDFEWGGEFTNGLGVLPWQKVADKKQAVHGAPLKMQSDSATQHFSVNSVPVFDDDGNFRGAMAAFADVTNIEEKKKQLSNAMCELRDSHNDIAIKNKELEVLATRDPLTNCLNRRSLFERFEGVWQQANRNNTPLACIMVDIDFFKAINDNYGHSTGDEVLRSTGSVLLSQAREYDLPARYGGEEFCIILPGTNLSDAFSIAERIRSGLAKQEFDGFSITASLGVSSTELNPQDPQGLIDQADKCLYAAKRKGRNQTIRFDQIDDSVEVNESIISRTPKEVETNDCPLEPEIPYRNVAALLSTLAYRNPETAAHSTRVADLAVAIGRKFLGPREVYRLEIAALLHDIGKIGVPDSILLKPGPLTEKEWGVMHMHDHFGVEIVTTSFGVESLTEIIRHHHSRYDSGGGEQLPLSARIVAIADAYDAMISDRPFRKGKSVQEALAELRRHAGKQFDPNLIEVTCELIAERTAQHPEQPTEITQEVALGIGRQIESLLVALDNEDLPSVAALSQRLSDTARQSRIPVLAEAAEQLSHSACEDTELVNIVDQMHGVLQTSSAMYASVLNHVSHSRTDEIQAYPTNAS